MTNTKIARDVLDTLSTLEMLVLDGRGGGYGFCNASDRVASIGLMTSADGELTALGAEVLRLAKMFGEI